MTTLQQDLTNNNDLKSKYKQALNRIEELSKLNNVIEILTDCADNIIPKTLKIEQSGNSESTANIVFSDWHLDEIIEGKRINNINSYDSTIFKIRLNTVLSGSMGLIDMCRSKSRIDTLIIYLLGDFISGHIHEDLVESSIYSPIEAAIQMYESLINAINFYIENGDFKNIVIACACGNHGRNTIKPRVKKHNENNLEYLIYYLLQQYYKKNTKVTFNIANGYFGMLNCYDYVVRYSHGHYINYKDGVGGVTIPLNKAIAKWQKAKYADLDIMGHWHQRICMPKYILNGCLIGYSEYAERIKAEPEQPSQSFFLIHPRFGKTVEAPLYA
jgi:hypothetical protein